MRDRYKFPLNNIGDPEIRDIMYMVHDLMHPMHDILYTMHDIMYGVQDIMYPPFGWVEPNQGYDCCFVLQKF